MTIRVVSLKAALWWLAFLLVAFAFPLQVYAKSPLPSLLGYIVIAVILAVHWAFPRPRASSPTRAPTRRTMRRIVGVYAVMVIVSAGWQATIGLIGIDTAISGVIVFFFPVVCYWYFRGASAREVRAALWAIALAGLGVGVYFGYDSFSKLALGRVTSYSIAAHEYTLARSNTTNDEANLARIAENSRAFGLLETHSVSGAWIVLGTFAALALVPRRRKAIRGAIILAAGGLLLLGLNFTAIIAFTVMVFVLEFGGAALLRARFAMSTPLSIALMAVIVGAAGAVVLWAVGETMREFIFANLRFQKDLATGGAGAHASYMDIITETARSYLVHIDKNPMTLLFGDGFGTYGTPKGGDIGIIETLGRLGLPLFAIIFIGLVRLIRVGLVRLTTRAGSPNADVGVDVAAATEFWVAVLMLVLLMDIHYSVWYAKSVLPIVFFALALSERTRAPNRPVPASDYSRMAQHQLT